MDITILREFTTLARILNYSKAAEALFIAQPTLSKHISLLEKEVGVKLFLRSTQKVELTQAGRIMLESGEKILLEFNSMKRNLEKCTDLLGRKLRVGMLYYDAERTTFPVLAKLKELSPHLEVILVSCQPERSLQELWAGNVDLTEVFRVDFPGCRDLRYCDTVKVRFSAMMPESHPLAHRKSISLEELRGETIVLQHGYLDSYRKRFLAEVGIGAEDILPTDNIDTVVFSVKTHQAVSIIVSQANIPHSGCRLVPISDEKLCTNMAYAWRPENENPGIQEFRRAVDALFRT